MTRRHWFFRLRASRPDGRTEAGDGRSAFAAFSKQELARFCAFLQEAEGLAGIIDADSLESDLQNGWYLDSDVPIGYGLGSSGMVVAAVYDRYARSPIQDAMDLKALFARMEGYFHGSSSGIDPLQCYLGKPFEITPEGLELLDDELLSGGIQICLIDIIIKSITKFTIHCVTAKNDDSATAFLAVHRVGEHGRLLWLLRVFGREGVWFLRGRVS